MRKTRSHFGAGVRRAAFVALALSGAAKTASACSIEPFSPYERSGAALFIGEATRDSLPARLTRSARRLFTPSVTVTLQPPPFAQVAQVERLSLRIPPDVKKAIAANKGRVLLVPWGYGSDCEASSWIWGALWTTPGQRGVFAAELRERERWENGVPTFDVLAPSHSPYPAALSLRWALRGKPVLSPEELLEMFDSIPQRGIRYDDPVRAKAIITWAETHADQASREPLAELVSFARYAAITAPFNDAESPLTGTYRFAIQFPNADSLIFFGRTAPRSTSLLWPQGVARDPKGRPMANPNAYELLVGRAKEVAGLPTAHPLHGQGFFAAAFEPVSFGADSTVWSAGIDFPGFVIAFVSESAMKARLMAARHNTFAGIGGVRRYTPGTFVRRADGSVTLHVELRDGGEVIGVVRGQRISPVSLIK